MAPKKYELLPALLDMCGGGEAADDPSAQEAADAAAVKAMLPWNDLRDGQLWLARPEPRLSSNEREVMQWHPRANSRLPVLPGRFTAYDLAAFMLAGGGLYLHERFDCDALDAEALSNEGIDHEGKPKIVVLSGEYEAGLLDTARKAQDEFEDELRKLGANADETREVIRKAMRLRRLAYIKFADSPLGCSDEGVRRAANWLLNEANSIAPLPLAEKAGPEPLRTSQIAIAFDGLRYTAEQWKKPLGDKPKWLKACVAMPGQRGVSETRWNPVRLGSALVQRGHASARSVRARFQRNPLLQPWLEDWKTYEADNIETE